MKLAIVAAALICACCEGARAQQQLQVKADPAPPEAILKVTPKELVSLLLKINDACVRLGGCQIMPLSDYREQTRELEQLRGLVAQFSRAECKAKGEQP